MIAIAYCTFGTSMLILNTFLTEAIKNLATYPKDRDRGETLQEKNKKYKLKRVDEKFLRKNEKFSGNGRVVY